MYIKRLLLLLVLTGLTASLCGCWLIYKPDIKQGNVLTTKQVHAIHAGMTQEQLIALLGKPVLVNVFTDNEMVYVYTILPRRGEFQAQQLRVYFAHGQVTHYTSNVH